MTLYKTRVHIKKQWLPAFVMLLGFRLSVEAHLGDRVYPIPYLTDEMLAEIQLADGQIQEWFDLLGEPTLSLLDFTEEILQSPLDPSDIDFRIWLAWHDDPARLYVAFVASDDVYKNTHDYGTSRNVIHENDSFMLAIDGDHSGGGGANGPLETDIENHGQAQYYEAISQTANGPTLNDLFFRFQVGQASWTTLPPYAASGGGVAGEAPVISVIELYVTPFDRWGKSWESPEGSVVTDFAAGKVIGFTFVVFDYDPPFDSGEWINWAPDVQRSDETTYHHDETTYHNVLIHRADTFLDGLLLPAEPGGDSAIQSVSWGRIKASLELE